MLCCDNVVLVVLVRVKMSCFGIKKAALVSSKIAGNIPGSRQKHHILSPKTRLEMARRPVKNIWFWSA